MPQKEYFIFVLSLEFFKEFFNVEQISIGKQAGNRRQRAKDTRGNVAATRRRYSKEVRSDKTNSHLTAGNKLL